MVFIPVINKDTKDIAEYISRKTEDPTSQRKIILVVVCVALLLDNMLYMVIVPIIPDYLRYIHAIGYWKTECYDNVIRASRMDPAPSVLPTPITIPEGENPNRTCRHHNRTWSTSDEDAAQIGILFASKAILQLFCNPISGTIIDRVGYDIPMLIGLMVIFLSTTVFAFGNSYTVMFIARSLQGLGSAFADTSGLAMIADRYTVEAERSKALGIALAFISFGSLVAPPFGGILYGLAGKVVPFIMLASIALIDGLIVVTVMRPARLERLQKQKSIDETPVKGTPIHRLLIDPYIAICAGALAMSNVSLAFLEPTIADWMDQTMDATSWEKGLVWLPAFIPHVAGVYTTVKLARLYPQYQWLMAAIGLAMEGSSCLLIPYCRNFVALMVPISIICYGIALVDTALLPTMGFLVDTRHVSVYGSVYAIADIAYSLAYAFGPVMAGGLVQSIGFLGMNISIFLSNVLYAPILYFLRYTYSYDNLTTEDPAGELRPDHNAESKETVGLVESNHSPATYRSYAMNGDQSMRADLDNAPIGVSNQMTGGDGYSYEGGEDPKFEPLPGPPLEYDSLPSSMNRDRAQVQYQTGHPPMPPTQPHQPQPRSQWNPEVDDPTIRQPLRHSTEGSRLQRTPSSSGKDRSVNQIRKEDYGY